VAQAFNDINPRWLKVSDACKYASMSKKKLMGYVKDGQIYGTLKGGNWYIDRTSIDKFMLADDEMVDLMIEKLGIASL
jgi:hypothetical protein